MLSPRWQKLLRDLWLGRGRLALMVTAVAISLSGVGTVLSAYAILTRELTRAYLSTTPASATLELPRVDEALVRAVRDLPDVKDAEARATILARVQVDNAWRPILLFVVPDFDGLRLSTFLPESGAWPPPAGTMLVERTAYAVLEARPGDTLLVRTPGGTPQPLRISGTVHDQGLAPATMEREGYAYITPATLALLTGSAELDQLKILVADHKQDAASTERTARGVAEWLRAQGRNVQEIQVPPVGKHPHQGQMVAVIMMLLAFSLLALLLSAVLVANTLAAIMARQVREIGVMKAVGASNAQVAGFYTVMVLLLGAASLVVALPVGVFGGQALGALVARMLNFAIQDQHVPVWVLGTVGLAGMLTPLAAASFPVRRASRVSVREAIHDFGVSPQALGSRALELVTRGLPALDAVTMLGLRNAFRRPGRLLLTLGLMASGGAMFLTGQNVAAAWRVRAQEVNTTRRYDAEIRLQQPQPTRELVALVEGVAGVGRVETWDYEDTSFTQEEGIPVMHTYPDQGHGSFRILGAPVDTQLVSLPVLAGRWLQRGELDGVVLNHMAAALAPDVTVGSRVTLSVHGKATSWKVVGVVRDLGSPAAAYVTTEAFAGVAGTAGRTRLVRVAAGDADERTRNAVVQEVERALGNAGMPISLTITRTELSNAVGEHMSVVLGLLLALAALMTLVGVLGLAAAMSMNVLERTRELAVMQSFGATPALVLRVVMGEGVFVGILSGAVALVLAIPFSLVVGEVLGSLTFRMPLPLVVSPVAPLAWLVVVLVSSTAAVAIPALRASRQTVREGLAHT
ncbi:MAG: ABC transporter permease [Myxococcota bacterium]